MLGREIGHYHSLFMGKDNLMFVCPSGGGYNVISLRCKGKEHSLDPKTCKTLLVKVYTFPHLQNENTNNHFIGFERVK